MARIRARFQPWGDKAEQAHFHDLRRGAMDDAFWDEDELVDHRPKGRRKKNSKKPGCAGNEGGPHIYVWERESYPLWSGKYVVRDVKRCCGCLKIARTRWV